MRLNDRFRAFQWLRMNAFGRFLIALCSLLPAALLTAFAAAPPNIVCILVDDLGASDLGCYGSPFYKTPEIDRLAAEGVRFTQAYSACTVCSPTRAALLTGQAPGRLHVTDWIKGHIRPKGKLKVPDWTMFLPPERPTIARCLKSAGYATVAIGKWHLGAGDSKADKVGFDVDLTSGERGQPPSFKAPYRMDLFADAPEGEFLTDRESAEACRFIEKNRDRPFFVYLAHHAVHQPIAGKPEVIEAFRAQARPDRPHHNPVYAALIASVDESLGTLRRKLAELKLAENTVIVFTSDNGGLNLPVKNPVTTNLGLRVGKGSAYEGGVRVPLIVYWPEKPGLGKTVPDPVITMDFFPTFLEMAGAKMPSGHVPDGLSLVPALTGTALPDRPLFWHYPHYHPGGATPYSAIRRGEWKLIEFFEDGRRELYHLSADPAETHNLAATEPLRAESLAAELKKWRDSAGCQLPTPNPNFDPADSTWK